jgi:DNA primase
LTQAVKTQNPFKGELSHGVVEKDLHQGVQTGRCAAAGFPCVALMGSSMSEAQEELLMRHFKAACILLDGDEAGQEGAADCLARLGRRIWAWAPALSAGKQPDMLMVEEIQALLKK